MSDKKNDKIVEINNTLDRLAKLVEANARQLQADRAEAKRQRDEDKRQRDEDKRQRDEDKRQRDEDKRQLAKDRAEWKLQRAKERAEDRAEDKLRKEEVDRRQARLDVKAKQMMDGINALREQYQEEGDRWGKITESLMAGELANVMLNRFGIKLRRIERNISFNDEPEPCEIDAIGVNGDLVTVVEAKTTLNKNDINAFRFKILDRFTDLMSEHRGKKIYGGVAYIKISNKEKESEVVKHAEELGLFVIKVIGDSNKIVNSSDFVPRDFHPQP